MSACCLLALDLQMRHGDGTASVKSPEKAVGKGKTFKQAKKKKQPSDSENICLCLKQKTVFDVAPYAAQHNLTYIHKLR